MLSFTVIMLFCLVMAGLFFSKEISGILKNLFAIYWIKVLLPLLLASMVVIYYEPYLLIVLLYIKWALYQGLMLLISELPFQTGAWVLVTVPLFLCFTILPIWCLKYFKERHSVIPFRYVGISTTILWLFIVVLFAVSMHG